jgi:hypothetical protein
MGLLQISFFILCSYLTWAVVLSDSFFHRVWSLALIFFFALSTLLYIVPISVGYTILLVTLDVLLFALCVALSPAQIFFFNATEPNPRRKALEIFPPKSDSLENGRNSPPKIFAEFVAPLP